MGGTTGLAKVLGENDLGTRGPVCLLTGHNVAATLPLQPWYPFVNPEPKEPLPSLSCFVGYLSRHQEKYLAQGGSNLMASEWGCLGGVTADHSQKLRSVELL